MSIDPYFYAQRWLAERIGLKSPANASHVVRRFEEMDGRDLADEISEWRNLKHVDCPLFHYSISSCPLFRHTKGICKDVTGMGRSGNGNVQVNLTSLDELPYVIGLVRQSLELQLGNGGEE